MPRTAATDEVRVLSVRRVAELLDVHPDTIRRAAARGALEPVRLTPTGQLRFRRSEVERLIGPIADRIEAKLAAEPVGASRAAADGKRPGVAGRRGGSHEPEEGA